MSKLDSGQANPAQVAEILSQAGSGTDSKEMSDVASSLGSILDMSTKKKDLNDGEGFLKHHVDKVTTKSMKITERAE